MLPSPVLFDESKHSNLVDRICQIHRACIIHDHQILAFLPGRDGDISDACLKAFWEAQLAPPSERARKDVLVQLGLDRELLGFVVLDMPFVETGPFRAWVQKLMVSPDHRRQGVATNLLQHVEEVAKQNHRYLLMLDVPVGSPAEESRMYEKCGYKEIGVIPQFSISPKDGTLVDEKFFYKDLRHVEQRISSNTLAVF